jgi:periplasmic copper chaperone A
MAAAPSIASRRKLVSLTGFIGGYRGSGTTRLASALWLGAWLGAGCSFAVAAASGAQPSSAVSTLEIQDAWIRWLPAGLPAAGYLTLINHGDQPIRLTGASSDAYRDISLHHSMSHEGMSHMESVGEITVPAHSTLRFAATGYHLMLMQPAHTLAPGDHVVLALHFAGSADYSASFEVRAPNGNAPAQNDMQGMPGMHDMQNMHPTTPPTTSPR